MTQALQLERTLHGEIPLSQAMGIRVASYDGACLRLAAPLAPNINHKLTAFGGSLYALAVLCGWGLIHLKLGETGLHKHIVIQEGSINYLRPVNEDLVAECRLDDAEWRRFLRTLERHDRARLALGAAILHDALPAVEFTGRYVVHG